MRLNSFTAWLAAAAEQPAAGGLPGQPPPWYLQYFPFLLLLVVFYVALIRPQQKKAKEHSELMKNLRAGDKIVTNGGVIGVVVTVKDNSVMLRSADTKMEILKSAVSAVTERNDSGSNS